jgi:hypothetical protein
VQEKRRIGSLMKMTSIAPAQAPALAIRLKSGWRDRSDVTLEVSAL